MIVKNESQVIERCLESVLPLIDTWVIVDTGSTDGTQEIIKKYLKKIPGTLHERPWVNFGFNRQEALELAKDKADYILFMDADDKLVYADDFKLPPLTESFYGIMTRFNGLECLLPRLIKASLPWRWEGALHEQLMINESTNGSILSGVQYVYISDGARSKDPARYKKDIKVLEDAMKAEPNNSRYAFYLGKTCMLDGDLPKALKSYQHMIELGGTEEETFCSMLDLAKAQDLMKMDPKIVEASYLRAYEFRPGRAEPVYYLASKARNNGDYAKGFELARLGQQIPTSDCQFVEKWIYEYGMAFEYAVCAFNLKKYQECLETCEKMLAISTLPEPYKADFITLRNQSAKLNLLSIQQQVVEVFKK
jgi:glycosyltransferase involved in cell wall biosynthesis